MVKYRLFKDSVWTAPREDALEKVTTSVQCVLVSGLKLS